MKRSNFDKAWVMLLALGTLAAGAWAQEGQQFPQGQQAQEDEDAPGRGVVRISLIQGDVSVKRGDSGEWIAAAMNAPLVVEDRLFAGPASRAELQFDYANMLRVAPNSEVRMSELEYRRIQVAVARGTVTFRVLRDSDAEVDINTPNVSVRPVKRGEIRITVLEDGSSEITVRSGEAEIFTPRGSERLRAGRTLVARGTASDPEFRTVAGIPEDEWDRWNDRRDKDLERSRSYEHVSQDIYGAEELDDNGDWIQADSYGYVWAPRVAPGWAPYRYGRWSWVDYYGWSWVSYDPWGWAPYHYGRWFQYGSRWCWYPGGRQSRHYWRPALVAFFGFGNHGGFRAGVGFGFGRVGWVPLAPFEPFHPWYGRGTYRGYRNGNDRSVRIVNNTNITNIYRNARIDNAVTGVDATNFGRGQAGNPGRVNRSDIERAGLVRGQLPLTPGRDSQRIADRDVRSSALPRGGDDTRFFSRRQPNAVERVPFEDQRRGVENVARRTFNESGEAGGRRGEAVRGDVATGGRGAVQPSEATRGAGTGAEADSGRGWRRVGEAVSQPDSRGGTGVRGGGTRTEGTDSGGWQRFGEPRREGDAIVGGRRGETAGAESVGGRGQGTARESTDGWRRFGDVRRESDGGVTVRPEQGNRGADAGVARREPSSRQSQSNDGSRGASSDTWRRFDSNPGSGRSEARANESRGSDRGESVRRSEGGRSERQMERSEPVRVNPPMVRERSSGRQENFGSSPRGGGSSDSGMRGFGSAPRSGGDSGGGMRGGGGSSQRGGGDRGSRSGGGDSGSRGGGGQSRGNSGGRNR